MQTVVAGTRAHASKLKYSWQDDKWKKSFFVGKCARLISKAQKNKNTRTFCSVKKLKGALNRRYNTSLNTSFLAWIRLQTCYAIVIHIGVHAPKFEVVMKIFSMCILLS